jgi:hypothetical protein
MIMTAENVNTDLPLLVISSKLLRAENVNSDLPPIGFCNEFLLGSKYAGSLLGGSLMPSIKQYRDNDNH